MPRPLLFLFTLSLAAIACAIPYNGAPTDVYAWNYPASIDSSGVVIQIGRVAFAKQGTFDDDFFQLPYFQDKPVVGELIFVVKNTAGQSMNVYPDQGHVVVGGEQVNLLDVAFLGTRGDPLGGEILPGVTKIGTIWFGLRRTKLEDLQSMTLVIAGPHDNGIGFVGEEYQFQLDLSDHSYEDMPDELK